MKKLITTLYALTIVFGVMAQNNDLNFNKTNDYSKETNKNYLHSRCCNMQQYPEPPAELELEIMAPKAGEEMVLENVSFASNSYKLKKTSFVELDKLIAYLQKNPNLQVEIQGYTDDVGNKKGNQILSEKRAQSVFDYLSSKVGNNLTYKGYGESQPLMLDKSRLARKMNRRTSFIVKDDLEEVEEEK